MKTVTIYQNYNDLLYLRVFLYACLACKPNVNMSFLHIRVMTL